MTLRSIFATAAWLTFAVIAVIFATLDVLAWCDGATLF
jgi:hypothetical protein